MNSTDKIFRNREAATIAALLVMLTCLSVFNARAQSLIVQGRVEDADTDQPISYAHVIWSVDRNIGAATAADGRFRLQVPKPEGELIVTAVGYASRSVALDDSYRQDSTVVIRLKSRVLHSGEEIIVQAEADERLHKLKNGKAAETTSLIEKVSGISLIRRANFALEPMIRGMNGDRVTTVIDGMKVFGACTDKMDPITSYVEVENLKKMDINKGAFSSTYGAAPGGSMNLVTYKPNFSEHWSASATSAYETASSLRRIRSDVNYSNGPWAARGSFSFKKAGDFSAGDGDEISGSQYQKLNYKVDLSRQIGANQKLTASYLGDRARDVGYPVLLMDATSAKADIGHITHRWQNMPGHWQQLKSKVYLNQVRHKMDDYSRNVTEREVMRNMYMPMYGETTTFGWLEEAVLGGPGRTITLVLDYYHLLAFGDMTMESIYPDVPDMYLLNLGDVSDHQAAFSATWAEQLSPDWQMEWSLSNRFATRDVQRQSSQRYFRTVYALDDTRRTEWSWNVSGQVQYAVNEAMQWYGSVARSARLPGRTELYGHYIYNYQDGYFYTGNPNIDQEVSYQTETGISYASNTINARLTGFFNYFTGYIEGIEDDDFQGISGNYRFKRYAMFDKVLFTGVEVQLDGTIAQHVYAQTAASYTWAKNFDLGEPVRNIPPLDGWLRLMYDYSKISAATTVRWAAPQYRIAEQTSMEDKTDGYVVTDLRASYKLFDRATVSAGVNNLLDTYYIRHTSIGNLPELGRNVYLELSVKL